MSGRKGDNPNAPVQGDEKHTRRVVRANQGELNELAGIREEARVSATGLDETMTLREADARREVPRRRTDSANPREARPLPSPGTLRKPASSRKRKKLNVAKRSWEATMPKNQYRTMHKTVADTARLEATNRALQDAVGMRSDLSPAVARHVSEIDRAIQAHEAKNTGEHIIYAKLNAPKKHGNSRNALWRRMEARHRDEDSGPLQFDGYIQGSHSIDQIKDDGEAVMEIKTRSGAYLGSTDNPNNPNADHLMPRGASLRVVNTEVVDYQKPDGSIGKRRVIQMEDITDSGRTTARR